MSLRKLIIRLPFPILRSLGSLYRVIPSHIRFGKVFWETYHFLQRSQWWSRERLEEYQFSQLEKLLKHAYDCVPYYRRLFDETGLKPSHIQNFEDLKSLPYLTKDMFRQNYDTLIEENSSTKGFHKVNTSGTTGKPLQFYENKWTTQMERAFIYHQWSRVGVTPDDPMLQMRGPVIQDNIPEYYLKSKTLRLSPRVGSLEIVRFYLEEMKKSGASYLHGYPSAIALFALTIKQHGLIVPIKIEAILFASEAVYAWERKIVEEVFGCRVFSFYGMAEKVVLAAECETSHDYHCLPQYGITEIDEKTKEIIGTGFLNHLNPFIRYRTTDVAYGLSDSECKDCGRHEYPVFSGVEGRLEDFIVTTDGVPISPAIITHPMKDLKAIKSTQLLQKSLDSIKVKIVPWNQHDPKTLDKEADIIRQGIQGILGVDMKVEIEITQSVELSATGKFKWVISDVHKGFLEIIE